MAAPYKLVISMTLILPLQNLRKVSEDSVGGHTEKRHTPNRFFLPVQKTPYAAF